MRISDWSSDVCSSDLVTDLDPDPAQVIGVADPGHLKQMRAADRTGRQDYLLSGRRRQSSAVLQQTHADGSLAIKSDLLDLRLGEDLEVRAVPDRVQEAAGSTLQVSFSDRELVRSEESGVGKVGVSKCSIRGSP